ncbi:TetR/AcrR family transcriptional regulator [Methylobacterium aquaticum]|uniref:TetR/AcrR family transcriptional regulator n=1 Tax=Methylobacterium aquaticum TaxID=270351 RepID=UPI003D1780D8
MAMDKKVRDGRRGPRSFNRDVAVETAMRLFWRHGYEGVSVADLTTAIGIAPPSLYAAFGSKAGLFREALDRYALRPGALDGLAAARTLEEAVGGLLRAAVRAVSDPDGERGCMVSSGLIQCAAEHDDLARDLLARRRAMRDAIARSLARWIDPPEAGEMANYLATVLQGLAVQARDGADRAALEGIVARVMDGIGARPPRDGAAGPGPQGRKGARSSRPSARD